MILRDPTHLYAPGQLYHIVERKLCRCGRYPSIIKTAVPVHGRFEHIVLSCNAISDHAIIWIEREGQQALDLMLEDERTTKAPEIQRMDDESPKRGIMTRSSRCQTVLVRVGGDGQDKGSGSRRRQQQHRQPHDRQWPTCSCSAGDTLSTARRLVPAYRNQ